MPSCPRCNEYNNMGSSYCKKCGQELGSKTTSSGSSKQGFLGKIGSAAYKNVKKSYQGYVKDKKEEAVAYKQAYKKERLKQVRKRARVEAKKSDSGFFNLAPPENVFGGFDGSRRKKKRSPFDDMF